MFFSNDEVMQHIAASTHEYMEQDMNNMSEILKARREQLRMTQEHLAEAAGLSARTVIRAEQGKVISAEAARALCAVLEMDIASLPLAEEAPVPAPVRASALERWLGRVGITSGRVETVGGYAGCAMLGWGGARLAAGIASFTDQAMMVLGVALVLTLALDRAWRWAKLYEANVMDRPSLAFRFACYGIVGVVPMLVALAIG
jgi:transcriptional regulator with XRE-family HTH domain